MLEMRPAYNCASSAIYLHGRPCRCHVPALVVFGARALRRFHDDGANAYSHASRLYLHFGGAAMSDRVYGDVPYLYPGSN